jgi:hypothetical protein
MEIMAQHVSNLPIAMLAGISGNLLTALFSLIGWVGNLIGLGK